MYKEIFTIALNSFGTPTINKMKKLVNANLMKSFEKKVN